MKKDSGIIFNIQRYSINDGPGIRTCIFLKGCPLDCIWCHNPESKSRAPELSFFAEKCVGCGTCVQACPNGCHHFEEGVHIIDRSRCIGCGRCVYSCVGALELFGKEMTAEAAVAEACKDRPFYENSGGGVTFTGGEPFAQPEFLLAMLKESKRQKLHVCVETCGYVSRNILLEALPNVDLFLYDYKETDPDRHKAFTGVDNRLILENLELLSRHGKNMVLRCPIIPGYNDREAHLKAIASIANRYPSILRIEVEPYHPLGQSKSESIGKTYPIKDLGITREEQTARWIETIRRFTNCEVRKG